MPIIYVIGMISYKQLNLQTDVNQKGIRYTQNKRHLNLKFKHTAMIIMSTISHVDQILE